MWCRQLAVKLTPIYFGGECAFKQQFYEGTVGVL